MHSSVRVASRFGSRFAGSRSAQPVAELCCTPVCCVPSTSGRSVWPASSTAPCLQHHAHIQRYAARSLQCARAMSSSPSEGAAARGPSVLGPAASPPTASTDGSATDPGSSTNSAEKARPKLTSKYCRHCAGPMSIARPTGEKEWRHVCSACGAIEYLNPKMVVGCIVEHEGKILLCRRAIEPCRGAWTVPAGYMELNESTAEGAMRETFEEANAHVKVIAPYAHFDIPVIGQAYILFRAVLAEPFSFSPGPESLETALFEPAAIPWAELAFSSVSISLRLYTDDLKNGHFRLHHGVIDKVPGSGPNDHTTYQLRDHIALTIAS